MENVENESAALQDSLPGASEGEPLPAVDPKLESAPPVPVEADFMTDEYIGDKDLVDFCEKARSAYAAHLSDVHIKWRWRAKGGTTQGRATFAKTVKLAGLTRHYGHCDVTIWFGADHLRLFKPTAHQFRALVFHELQHIVYADGNVSLVGHDLEMFCAEVREFGLWRTDLVKAAEAFKGQLELFQKKNGG